METNGKKLYSFKISIKKLIGDCIHRDTYCCVALAESPDEIRGIVDKYLKKGSEFSIRDITEMSFDKAPIGIIGGWKV